MKDDDAPKTSPGGFGPDYVGWAVPVTATAYVMANSYEEAEFKVNAGLRKQQRVMLTKLVTHQPVLADAPDAIENIPIETVTVQRIVNRELVPDTVTITVPPCTFCDHHKKDISKKGACTPGQTCHADYWRTRVGGK